MTVSCILGTGCYVPPRVVTNFDVMKMMETSDEFIVKRTGVRRRRHAPELGDEPRPTLEIEGRRGDGEHGGAGDDGLQAHVLSSLLGAGGAGWLRAEGAGWSCA